MENLPVFIIFWKFYRTFRENSGKNLGKFGNIHLEGVGAEPPEASEFIKILVDKSMETCNYW